MKFLPDAADLLQVRRIDWFRLQNVVAVAQLLRLFAGRLAPRWLPERRRGCGNSPACGPILQGSGAGQEGAPYRAPQSTHIGGRTRRTRPTPERPRFPAAGPGLRPPPRSSKDAEPRRKSRHRAVSWWHRQSQNSESASSWSHAAASRASEAGMSRSRYASSSFRQSGSFSSSMDGHPSVTPDLQAVGYRAARLGAWLLRARVTIHLPKGKGFRATSSMEEPLALTPLGANG